MEEVFYDFEYDGALYTLDASYNGAHEWVQDWYEELIRESYEELKHGEIFEEEGTLIKTTYLDGEFIKEEKTPIDLFYEHIEESRL